MTLTQTQTTGDALNVSLKIALSVPQTLNALNVQKVNSFKLMDLNVSTILNASFLIIFNQKDLKKEMVSGSVLNVIPSLRGLVQLGIRVVGVVSVDLQKLARKGYWH